MLVKLMICDGVEERNVPEDVVEDVEAACFGHQREGLRKLERIGAIIYDKHAGDEDDKAVSVARGLCIARVDLVLNLLKRQALLARQGRVSLHTRRSKSAKQTYCELLYDSSGALQLRAFERQHRIPPLFTTSVICFVRKPPLCSSLHRGSRADCGRCRMSSSRSR